MCKRNVCFTDAGSSNARVDGRHGTPRHLNLGVEQGLALTAQSPPPCASDCATPRHATLRYATLRCAALRYATLRYATLCYATLRYATLRYAALRCATPRHATLRYATLRCAALRCAALRCATLRYATLRYAMLRYAALRCAALRCATLRYATLRYAMKCRIILHSVMLTAGSLLPRRPMLHPPRTEGELEDGQEPRRPSRRRPLPRPPGARTGRVRGAEFGGEPLV